MRKRPYSSGQNPVVKFSCFFIFCFSLQLLLLQLVLKGAAMAGKVTYICNLKSGAQKCIGEIS